MNNEKIAEIISRARGSHAEGLKKITRPTTVAEQRALVDVYAGMARDLNKRRQTAEATRDDALARHEVARLAEPDKLSDAAAVLAMAESDAADHDFGHRDIDFGDVIAALGLSWEDFSIPNAEP